MRTLTKRQDSLIVAGYDAAHLLEPVEHALAAVAIPVTSSVCFPRSLAAFAWWNDWQAP
ncbi:hypothetical protein NBRC3257_3167 [Gluconobacter thailandicus NBRC 3257]|uniref:Uncharacterized protein n=1 Tax=Gluconobacter thailandicus NBRC 3257 TaxID=1381097 RepID=A0ABQ0J127_GLUTH|nr:hypothetical protein NBRC3257_3167 [Gluconobacter thailandicus NBRC 3257]